MATCCNSSSKKGMFFTPQNAAIQKMFAPTPESCIQTSFLGFSPVDDDLSHNNGLKQRIMPNSIRASTANSYAQVCKTQSYGNKGGGLSKLCNTTSELCSPEICSSSLGYVNHTPEECTVRPKETFHHRRYNPNEFLPLIEKQDSHILSDEVLQSIHNLSKRVALLESQNSRLQNELLQAINNITSLEMLMKENRPSEIMEPYTASGSKSNRDSCFELVAGKGKGKKSRVNIASYYETGINSIPISNKFQPLTTHQKENENENGDPNKSQKGKIVTEISVTKNATRGKIPIAKRGKINQGSRPREECHIAAADSEQLLIGTLIGNCSKEATVEEIKKLLVTLNKLPFSVVELKQRIGGRKRFLLKANKECNLIDPNIWPVGIHCSQRSQNSSGEKIWGLNENPDTLFLSGQPLSKIFIGRCNPSTSEQNVRAHLTSIGVNEDEIANISCLTTSSDSVRKAFLIETQRKFDTLLLSSVSWPEGIHFRRYRYRHSEKVDPVENCSYSEQGKSVENHVSHET